MSKICTSAETVCVIGLGFVGLPLAIAFAKKGIRVAGVEIDERKIQLLQSRKSYIADLTDHDLQVLADSGIFTFSSDFRAVSDANTVLICVPTPLNKQGKPDLLSVLQASESISPYLTNKQLIILESSTFPGTTEEHVIPILETSGLESGTDFYVAYSPERINPGESFDLHKIPKIVGGVDEKSLNKAIALYSMVFDRVVPVSSIRVAELTKLLENTQRFVNISLMNELSILCNKWGINLWEAIDAAATKPYGFVPYYPGTGVGGHCIPVDPIYLQWFSQQSGNSFEFVSLSQQINKEMPRYVATRILSLTTSLEPSVLLIGITYKRDVNDLRESSALKVFEELYHHHVSVEYSDPFVSELRLQGRAWQSIDLTPENIARFDVVAILTDHTHIDYELIRRHSNIIFDSRNVYKHGSKSENVILL